MMTSMRRWVIGSIAAVLAVTTTIALGFGLVGFPRATGYFSPIFATDGQTVYTIRRTAMATVIGPGQQLFTPPAQVRVHRDRFSLLRLRIADGKVSVLDELPASPFEGASLRAYHGAIFGTPRAHVRRAGDRIEYEVGVTRHDTPLARTFVLRRMYDPAAGVATGTTEWVESHPAMFGDEAAQLHGDLETMAMPGEEFMPCGIAVLRQGETQARSLIQTSVCSRKYPAGFGAVVVVPLSRRADVERAEMLRTTHAQLVDAGRRAGLSEGDALLAAGKEMSRRGLYPKTPTIVAAPVECGSVAPIFRIAQEQFDVGLFPDIAEAIASPGEEIDKSMGAYITHRDYTTSQEINAFLDAGNAVFHVHARGRCWRLTVERPR